MKRCKVCDVKKELFEFYKSSSTSDGYHNTCKYCWKIRRSKNYFNKRDYFRKKCREYYVENSEQIKARSALQQRNPETTKKFRKQNPEKYKAHYTVSNGLKRGIIKKAERCEICGETKKLHAHHEDYSKPLQVMWVCPTCHSKIHEKIIN